MSTADTAPTKPSSGDPVVNNNYPEIVDGRNIGEESYYNQRQISDSSKFANPEAALKSNGGLFEVTRDCCGNILTSKFIPQERGELIMSVTSQIEVDQGSSSKPNPFNIVGALIDYENGDLDEEQTIELFQKLIDTNYVGHLQGSYGRMAASLIADGYCTPKGI